MIDLTWTQHLHSNPTTQETPSPSTPTFSQHHFLHRRDNPTTSFKHLRTYIPYTATPNHQPSFPGKTIERDLLRVFRPSTRVGNSSTVNSQKASLSLNCASWTDACQWRLFHRLKTVSRARWTIVGWVGRYELITCADPEGYCVYVTFTFHYHHHLKETIEQ